MTAVAVGASTRVRLHPLHMRADGDEWCVGRIDTGDFVAVPPIAVEVLDLLRDGLTVEQVAARLREVHGRDIDVAGFVTNLVDLGYVRDVDGTPVDGPEPAPPTWPWLRPGHVRWALSPAVPAAVLALAVAAAVVLAVRPSTLPTYRDLLWSPHGSVVLAGNALLAWCIVFVHELAHLATARAAGVPGRVRFGTRLQFLVVQTEVGGVWSQPRRTRLTVYLAGIATHVATAALAVLGRAAVGPATSTGRVLGAVAVLSMLFVPPQLLVFMRTDVYFLVQDLARCRNLYADGSAYARYSARRAWAVVTRRRPPADPSTRLPAGERRAVRAYTWVLVLGTAGCLTFAAAYSLPVALALLAGAVRRLAGTGGQRLDGALTLTFIGGTWALWLYAWTRRHGHRLRAWYRRHRTHERG